jgi:hypothetical protein
VLVPAPGAAATPAAPKPADTRPAPPRPAEARTADTPPAAARPARTAEPAPPRPAKPAAVPEPAPVGPGPACGARSDGVRFLVCMERECGTSAFASHPACVPFRQ